MAEDDQGRLLAFSAEGLQRREHDRWHLITSPAWAEADVMAMDFDRNGDVWLAASGWGMGQWQGYRHRLNWTGELGQQGKDTSGFTVNWLSPIL